MMPALLLAEATVLRWKSLPPAWVIALVVIPVALALVLLAYRAERIETRRRLTLGVVRASVLLLAVMLLFGPFLERTIRRKVRSHLVVLLDTSASMDVADDVDPAIAGALSEATGVPREELGSTSRLELSRQALLQGGDDSPLEAMREKFVTHVYAFSAEPRILWSGDEAGPESAPDADPKDEARAALSTLKPDGASTRLADSLMAAMEDFRLRNEPVAGVVVISDGRQTAGSRTPREAGEAAGLFLQAGGIGERGVPVISVVAGDPSSSRNVQVRNLVAPEVVLARDDASFEFDVVQKGFDGQTGVLRIMFVEPRGENAQLDPGEVALVPGETGTRVKARYRFDRPGNYLIRVGVPPMPGERVSSDNWLEHHLRVVDRKVKVLYVDGRPRREWESLQRALTRDADTMLVHTLQMESSREVPQARTVAPGWPALRDNRFPQTRAELFEYDVVVLGDVDPRDLADTSEESKERLKDLRDFVEAGGGLLCIAGEFFMPSDYEKSVLASVFPVIIDRSEVRRAAGDRADAFNLALTPDGRESALLRIDADAGRSRALWESTDRWQQWWYYPTRRASSGARVLAVHPQGLRDADKGDAGSHGNRYGPHALVAVKNFGLGRCLWLGMEEFWRMRYGVGDQFYYGFYAKAIRYLAAYRMLGGNRRVKIHPERQVYFLDEPVSIVANVVGEDFRPPSPLVKPEVKAILTLPDRSEQSLTLLPVPQPAGESPRGIYRASFTAAMEGTYTVAPDPLEVPGEDPEAKSFVVQASAEETKDPSVDESALQDLATASGGRLIPLSELRSVADSVKARDFRVPVEARPDPLSDQWWMPVLLTLLLACEWLLRKRWRLL